MKKHDVLLNKISKGMRIITLAPLMAFATVTVLFINKCAFFGGTYNFIMALLFLTVLPLLAYPLQPYIPHFKDKGRDGQRTLAMIFAVCGYILGCVTGLALSAPSLVMFIYLEYLLSGMVILIFNKVFKLRASAHACGIIGPAVMLAYFGVVWTLPIGVILYFAAFWASVRMKRHTPLQFIGGAIIPIAVLMLLSVLF